LKETIRNFQLMIVDAQKSGVKIAFIGFVTPDFSSMSFKDWNYFSCQITYRHTTLYTPASYQKAIDIINHHLRRLAKAYGALYFDAPRRFQGRGRDMFFDPMHRTIPANEEWSSWIAQKLIRFDLLPLPSPLTVSSSNV